MRRAQKVGRAKGLMGSMVICIMLMGVMPIPPIVRAESNYYVAGTARWASNHQPVMETDVRLRNLETNESIYTVTDNNGYYQFNLSDFENEVQDGDYLEVYVMTSNGFAKPILLEFAPLYLPGNTFTIDPWVYSFPPIGIWLFFPINLNIVNRQSKDSVYLMCANGDYYLPQGYGLVELRAAYSYYDCAKNVPEQTTYSVTLSYTFSVICVQDPQKTQIKNAVCQYTISAGEEKQYDPYLAITLGSDYDEKVLTLKGAVDCVVMEGQTIVDHWYYEELYAGYKFYWT